MKIGIFGGSFNPLHTGHINSLLTVQKKKRLDKIFVIPSYQSPGRSFVESPTPEQRLEMVRLAAKDYPDILEIDSQEIERGGLSYTVDTLPKYVEEYGSENVHLIIGADVFKNFAQWKSFEKILSTVNLIVTTRPGSVLPLFMENVPEELREFVEDIDRNGALLSTGREVSFVFLNDIPVSGTEIRKCLRSGLKVDKYLPLAVENYIAENNLYAGHEGGLPADEDFVRFCSNYLFDKKGFNIRAFELGATSTIADFSMILSGTSSRHASSMADGLVQQVKQEFGVRPVGVEGQQEGQWVLVDYGHLVIHIFYDFVRPQYKLEELWEGARDLKLSDPKLPRSS